MNPLRLIIRSHTTKHGWGAKMIEKQHALRALVEMVMQIAEARTASSCHKKSPIQVKRQVFRESVKSKKCLRAVFWDFSEPALQTFGKSATLQGLLKGKTPNALQFDYIIEAIVESHVKKKKNN